MIRLQQCTCVLVKAYWWWGFSSAHGGKPITSNYCVWQQTTNLAYRVTCTYDSCTSIRSLRLWNTLAIHIKRKQDVRIDLAYFNFLGQKKSREMLSWVVVVVVVVVEDCSSLPAESAQFPQKNKCENVVARMWTSTQIARLREPVGCVIDHRGPGVQQWQPNFRWDSRDCIHAKKMAHSVTQHPCCH